MNKNNIEITRSYSQKKNLGNYETKDYFCSAKVECNINDVVEKSKMLDELVQGEVIKSLSENEPKKELGLVIEDLKFEKEI